MRTKYEVLTKSFINGAIVNGGEIVDIDHDETFKAGANLKEYTAPLKADAPKPKDETWPEADKSYEFDGGPKPHVPAPKARHETPPYAD